MCVVHVHAILIERAPADFRSSPECLWLAVVAEFMEGLDQEPLYADEISSQGCWTTLMRLLCCSLPPHRIR